MANEDTWRQLARQTTRKVNCGWWFQTLRAPMLISSLVIASTVLLLRRDIQDLSIPLTVLATLAGIGIIALICWWLARKHFESPPEAFVRLESSMRLQSSLTAADHGICPWPPAPQEINDGVQWHWRRLLTPLIATVAILVCGLTIPIQAHSELHADQPEPSAWNELETNIEVLDNQQMVQKEYLDDLREKLEKLRQQSPDEWFSHSSLEATDTLRQNHHNEQSRLSHNLQRAERSLQSLQSQSGQLSENQKQRWLNEYDQALRKMQQGAMQPNPELMRQLEQLDPQQLNQLTPEQLEQIRENMRRHAEGLQQAGNGQCQNQGEDGFGEDGNQDGENGENDNGSQPGSGGINRGPGTAPDVLGKEHPDTGTGKHQGLQSQDLSQSLPGELLQTSDAQHQVDTTTRPARAGGASNSRGDGGDRVWKNSLMPDEKKALKKFFE